MDRFGVGHFGRADDRRHVQVARAAAGPMQTDSSASFTYFGSRSASECTATVLMPILAAGALDDAARFRRGWRSGFFDEHQGLELAQVH
jgi:hypothetical protein